MKAISSNWTEEIKFTAISATGKKAATVSIDKFWVFDTPLDISVVEQKLGSQTEGTKSLNIPIPSILKLEFRLKQNGFWQMEIGRKSGAS